MLLLLPWDLYKCPRTLAVASACLRDGAATHFLLLALWAYTSFFSPSLKFWTTFAKSSNAGVRRSAKRCLQWLIWIPLTWLLSIPVIINQIAKSTPGLACKMSLDSGSRFDPTSADFLIQGWRSESLLRKTGCPSSKGAKALEIAVGAVLCLGQVLLSEKFHSRPGCRQKVGVKIPSS